MRGRLNYFLAAAPNAPVGSASGGALGLTVVALGGLKGVRAQGPNSGASFGKPISLPPLVAERDEATAAPCSTDGTSEANGDKRCCALLRGFISVDTSEPPAVRIKDALGAQRISRMFCSSE